MPRTGTYVRRRHRHRQAKLSGRTGTSIARIEHSGLEEVPTPARGPNLGANARVRFPGGLHGQPTIGHESHQPLIGYELSGPHGQVHTYRA